MNETVSYERLRSVLEEAGYVSAKLRKSHYIFINADRDQPEIALPLQTRYGERHILAVRNLLELAGILRGSDFDALLKNGRGSPRSDSRRRSKAA